MNETSSPSAGQVLAALGRAVAYLALFLGSQLLISVLFTAAVTLIILSGGGDGALLLEQIYGYTPHITLISGLITLAVLAVFFLIRRKKPLAEVRLQSAPGPALLAAAGVAPVLYFAVTLILSLLPEAWLESYAEASSALNTTGLLALLSTALVAPLVEEVIFRGLILSRLNRVLPGWLSLLLSALLFGLCHGQPVWIAYAFVLGLILGTMALRSGSILPSLVTHILFNAIGQLSVVLDESQINPWLLLGLLAAAGILVCLLARRGVAMLFRPNGKEQHHE